MEKWHKSGFKGVRYRKHPERKHGVQFDRYFVLTYKLDGKTKSESWGWASQGNKASDAYEMLIKLKKNQKSGKGPRTLEELRQERAKADKAAAARKTTLADYWPVYYESAKGKSKPSTASKEESHYRIWIDPLLGRVPIREISLSPHWDSLKNALETAERSERMKEYVTGTLRRILRHAYNRGIAEHPPPSGKLVGVTGPGNSNRRRRVISPNEANAIMQKLKDTDPNAWRLTKFAFLTGARASECFNLRWRDVDRGRGVIVFPETKNRDIREIQISDSITDLLDGLPACPIDANVFVGRDGKTYREPPYSFRGVVNALGLNIGRSQLDRISFHSIRHSVATELAKTLNLKNLMAVMGWRTVQMAMRYVHQDEDQIQGALCRLETALNV